MCILCLVLYFLMPNEVMLTFIKLLMKYIHSIVTVALCAPQTLQGIRPLFWWVLCK